jgi:WD40 repeat protein
VTAGNDGSIQLWDITGKKVVKSWSRLSINSINSISISPNGKILATAGDNSMITLSNLKGQQLSPPWKGDQGWIRSISFSPDGQLLATAGKEGTRLWNLQGQQLAKLDNNQGWDWTVRFSPDGQFLATGGIGGTRLWKLQRQQLPKLTEKKVLTEDRVRSVSFSPDGKN